MTILDRYFELSDLYYSDNSVLHELVGLFDVAAEIKPANGSIINGQNNIKDFYTNFFARNTILKHVWHTKLINAGLEAHWGVVGIRTNGDIISFKGVDTALLTSTGKIKLLEIKFL